MPGAPADKHGYLIAGDGPRALAALVFHAFVGVAVLAASRSQDWGWASTTGA